MGTKSKTPRTDAIENEHGDDLPTSIYTEMETLEREIADKDATIARLREALRNLDSATVRIGSFAPDNERTSLIFAQDMARAALVQSPS